MGLSHDELYQALLDNIGGIENIKEVSLDKGRIRFKLSSVAAVKEENVKKINNVLGIIETEEFYYIILEKSMVVKVFNEFKHLNRKKVKTSEIGGPASGILGKIKSFFSGE